MIARATGMTHAAVNGELNRAIGVNRITEATVDQLERRLTHARKLWKGTSARSDRSLTG